MQPFLHTYADQEIDLQKQMSVAVIITTTLKPMLYKTLQSVFQQGWNHPTHILIGIHTFGDIKIVEEACKHRPSHQIVQIYWPGYSTIPTQDPFSLHSKKDLQIALARLANASLITYLDDQSWWRMDHLDSLISTIRGVKWAWALRWWAHPEDHSLLCVDNWESVGPGKGVFREGFGGFVHPNCIIMDKSIHTEIMSHKVQSIDNQTIIEGQSEHALFGQLNQYRGIATTLPTVFSSLCKEDALYEWRLRNIRKLRYPVTI